MPRLKAISWVTFAFLALVTNTVGLAQTHSVDQLIEALGSDDAAAQVKAADDLAHLGAKAAPAVPALTQALTSSNADLRGEAAVALGAIGAPAEGAAAALTKSLTDDDAAVRARAAWALGHLGDKSNAIAEALIAAALDTDAGVRRQVGDALHKMQLPREMTLPLWVKTLKSAPADEIVPALMTLAEHGEDAVPALKEALNHEDAAFWATLIAAELGAKAKALTPELTHALSYDDPETRMNALIALGEIGPAASAAQDTIVNLLETEKFDNVRYAAAFALTEIADMQNVSDQTKMELNKLLQSDDTGLKSIAARGVLKVDPQGPMSDQARTAVVAALGSDNSDIRHLAVRTLAEMDPSKQANPEVVEAFLAVMQDASPHVVGEVIGALASQGKRAVPRVVNGLQNEKTRPYAIKIATLLGPDAAEATPALIETLANSSNADEKRELQFALGAIGPAAQGAVPELTKSLSSDTPEIRYSAAYALAQIGPDAKTANASLVELVKSEDEFDKLAGIWALLKINPNNERVEAVAVPRLTKALTDHRSHIRMEAANALGEIGAEAKSATTALQQTTQDQDPNVADAAKAALAKIQGQ